MASGLHKGRILRIRHFIAIDEKFIEIDLPLRLLIKPALIRSSNKWPRRDDNELLLQKAPQGATASAAMPTASSSECVEFASNGVKSSHEEWR